MARPEVTGRRIGSEKRPKKTPPKKKQSVALVPNAAAYNVENSARRTASRRACTTSCRAKGLGPREARALSKVIITQEAAADWRRQREAHSTRSSTSQPPPVAGLKRFPVRRIAAAAGWPTRQQPGKGRSLHGGK